MENLETHESVFLLKVNYLGHIAFVANNQLFIIPITYFYNDGGNEIIAYSGNGHKINAMRANPIVAFQVEDIKAINKWKSVLVHGKFEEINGTEAKFKLHQFANGVRAVISKKEEGNPQFISDFSSDIYSEETTIVYKIKLDDFVGKEVNE
jgi:nitroimidazol reductase NimA-like FMN-containing flavoprotein (pyridoxamine 5'-phosphate oxidase superfamily)